jgi:hypothetical protein
LTDDQPPTVKLTCPQRIAAGARQIELAAEISDDKALGASVLFCSHGDSVVWGKRHAGKADRVTVAFPIGPAEPGTIRLHFATIDHGGNLAGADGHITVR